MSDREERALGAGDTIEVKGKEFHLKPVVAQSLADLERAALKEHKRNYIETFTDNADLLGEDSSKIIADKLEQVARWTTDDLPQRTAYDCSQVPVNDKLKKWIVEQYGDKPDTDNGCRAVVSTALDNEEITPDKVKGMTGKRPQQGRVRFDQWWVTASITGMISIIKSSLSDYSKEEREQVTQWPFLKIAEAARIVERITSADLGNG